MHALRVWYTASVDIVYRLWKFILHQWTGQCEIVRICGNKSKMHSAEMTMHFASSLKRSKRLIAQSKAVFNNESFIVSSSMTEILAIKHISQQNSLLTANLRNCLEQLNIINRAIAHILSLKTQAYSDKNPQHVQLLQELWSNLRPNILRKGGRITEEWGELGFQGKDPATDFRGMGMLGLIQLVYFSKTVPELAISLLKQSQCESQYFPFAATGINVTAFIIEMLLERRFHMVIIHDLDKILLLNADAADMKCIQATANLVHHLYTILFLHLGKNWINSKARDLMEFPRVYKEFKDEVKANYPAL